jgi:broad-specificity NMP kinase
MEVEHGDIAPVTVEILGPPGSGKSTLVDALQASSLEIVPVSIYWRRLENLSVGVRSAVALIPIILSRLSGQALSAKHVVWMIRLEAADAIFQRKGLTRPSIALFDQGPVFTMVRLQKLALRAAEGSRLRRWWEIKLDEWAQALDLVIFLDAPNEVLIERIRRRTKSHVAKTQSYEETGALLIDERTRYVALTEALATRGSVSVLRLDTSASVDQVASEATACLQKMGSVEGRL